MTPSNFLRSLLLAGALGVTSAAAFGQETPTAPTSESKPAAVTQKTLFEQIKEGGWVMIPISLCSIFTVYLIGDGTLRTGKKRLSPPQYEQALKTFFRHGDYVRAHAFCKNNPSPLTNVLKVAISLLGEGKQATEEGILAELSKENSKLQTWISYLSVIGVCTPMIGLLGTVTGMIKAFATLGSSGIGDPSSLAAAIGEVLTATASGLFIAIPAFGAFYYLRNRAADGMHHIQDILSSLFRKMPYEVLEGVHIGDDELYAALPNWIASAPSVSPAGNAET
ncbi:MAG: MotA/TolQ/ExbB proton channel family protein [Chthoniobacteraceae bacterium]